MKLKEVMNTLEAKIYTGEELLEREISFGCASDMISDILALAKPGSLLLTGIIAPQIIRIAKILDLSGIVIVRGKEPMEETIAKAKEERVPLLGTKFLLFDACGKLYEKGLRGT